MRGREWTGNLPWADPSDCLCSWVDFACVAMMILVPPILLAQACDRHPVMLAYVLVSFVLTICCYFANTLSREKAEEWKAEWSRRQTLREA